MAAATKVGSGRHTFLPGRSVPGAKNKAAHAWVWELCKAHRLASWSYTKGEGFRIAWTESVHDAMFGSEEWSSLDVLDAGEVLSRCALLDPSGDLIPEAHADACRKVLRSAQVEVRSSGRSSVAELRALVAELSGMDLPEEARALLEGVTV